MKNDNPKFSYRNNENYEIHHGRFSNKHVELVYTKYEVKRSIIKEGGCIQPFNPVFDTLTVAAGASTRYKNGNERFCIRITSLSYPVTAVLPEQSANSGEPTYSYGSDRSVIAARFENE